MAHPHQNAEMAPLCKESRLLVEKKIGSPFQSDIAFQTHPQKNENSLVPI